MVTLQLSFEQVDMKTALFALRVISLCVMTRGLTFEQLCPEPLDQAPHAPWMVEAWPEFPSSVVVYHHSIRELPNNSFVFDPSKKVLVVHSKRNVDGILLHYLLLWRETNPCEIIKQCQIETSCKNYLFH